MSTAPTSYLYGSALTNSDLSDLADRWITPQLADQCGFRRVDSEVGRIMFGRKAGDCSGVIIPYVDPVTAEIREYQLRRDHPDREVGADGEIKETQKYLWAPGRRCRPYITPGTDPALLQDSTIPIIITEGAFKTAALHRLAHHASDTPRFVPVGLIGVYNFRTSVGKETDVHGHRADVKGFLPELDQMNWKDRLVFIAYDSDIAVKPQVKHARRQLTRALQDRGAKVGFVEWKPEQGKGIDDLLAAVGPDEVIAMLGTVDFTTEHWRSELILNKSGEPRAVLANAITALRSAPAWSGVLGFNEFSLATVALKPAPWQTTVSGAEWTDQEDRLAADWLQHHGILVSVEVAGQAVQTVARERQFHPVREYFDTLKWDGEKRLDSCLTSYLGVEPSNYTYAVGARWFISAVARIYQPGVKADCCLILEGKQGALKSTALRTIAKPWFTDEIADLGSKDAAMQVRGVLMIEIAELESMNRSEVGRIKAFMSRTTDRFRPPYGKRLIESPRQCIFAGSVNHHVYLRDETGGRRFWPVMVGAIDIPALERDRDQLWAEAVQRYRAGDSWWLDKPDLIKAAELEQDDRYDGDPWEQLIGIWIENRDSISVEEVLTFCIEKRRDMWTQSDKTRVSRCLRALKWVRFNSGPRGAREWRYRRVSGD